MDNTGNSNEISQTSQEIDLLNSLSSLTFNKKIRQVTVLICNKLKPRCPRVTMALERQLNIFWTPSGDTVK